MKFGLCNKKMLFLHSQKKIMNMFNDTTLLIINIINAACILVLILMLITLAAATRMKGGAGWAALIVTVAIVPASLSNLTRDLAMDRFVWFTTVDINNLIFK